MISSCEQMVPPHCSGLTLTIGCLSSAALTPNHFLPEAHLRFLPRMFWSYGKVLTNPVVRRRYLVSLSTKICLFTYQDCEREHPIWKRVIFYELLNPIARNKFALPPASLSFYYGEDGYTRSALMMTATTDLTLPTVGLPQFFNLWGRRMLQSKNRLC